MKTNFKFLLVALVAFSAFSITSCSKDDPAPTPTPAPQTIAQIAQGNPNLSILVEALTKAGLVNTLSSAGTYTVFAPDNAAFTAAGITSDIIADQTTPQQIAALKNVLLNHVLTTKFTSTQLTTGYKKTLAVPAANTSGLMSMYIKNSASGVFCNTLSKVTTPNVDASNGVIHIVNAVIDLPSVYTFIGADANLTTLYGALTAPDQEPQDFDNLLKGTSSSPFTIFAPINTAFTDYASESGNSTNDLEGSNLTKVLKYHVRAGQNLTSTALFNSAGPLETLLGQNITVAVSPTSGLKFVDQNMRIAFVAENYDIQANNGIIHQLTKVLKPTL